MRSEQDLLPLCIAVLVLAWVGYEFASPWMLSLVAHLASVELRMLAWLDRLALLRPWWSLEYELAIVQSLDFYDAQSQRERVYTIKRLTHGWLVWAALALNIFGIALLLSRAKSSLLGPLTLEQLDIFISRFYYPSRPVVGRHYEARHPVHDVQARFALKPWEFACQHGLLLNDNQPYCPSYGSGITLLKPSTQMLARTRFDRAAAREVFAQQLGTPLGAANDVLELDVEYRAIVVALLAASDAQLAKEFAPPEQWLKQFATSFWDLPKLLKQRPVSDLPPLRRATLDVSGVDACLQSALQRAEIRARLECSAYANVLLARLLQEGTIGCAKMVWLKPINRTLFYVLNNVGRPRRLFVEGHAALAHAQMEQATESPLMVAQVDVSVNALEHELQRHGWLPRGTP